MSTLERAQNDRAFYKIVDGALRRAVPAGTPGAEERVWQAGGKTGTAIELVYKAIFGAIRSVEFYEGEYEGKKFTNFQVSLDADDDGKTPIISIGSGTKYAFDLYHKLPNVDVTAEVRIRPFSFVPEGEDKAVTGIEIMQRDSAGNFTKSIPSFFFKKDGEKNVPINGFPTREKEYSEQTDEEREIYKIKRKGFLISFTKEKTVPKFNGETVLPRPFKSAEEEADVSQIPF